MGIAFDYAPDRPAHIDTILNGLDRYNPETTAIFQDYVTQQCEDKTYDCYANLALLKLYQFNPHLTRDDTVTSILTKSLTVFPAPDFSLNLHLLPPHILSPPNNPPSTNNNNNNPPNTPPLVAPAPAPASHPENPLTEAVQKLAALNTLLESANYRGFWDALDSDDLYADLVADVAGFEELMRVRIAVTVGQGYREVQRGVLEGWLNLEGAAFERFVVEICGWGVGGGEEEEEGKGKGGWVRVPVNKENEAKGTVVREEVKFDQFTRIIHRAYEQPA